MPRIRVTAKHLGDRHYQINLSNRIALITQSLLRAGKNNRRARVKAGYFGFNTTQEAIAFANGIRGRFPKARIGIRPGKRLQVAYEVKVSHDCVEQLAWEVVWQYPTLSAVIDEHCHRYGVGTRAIGVGR